jgi:hypothetical protein
MPGSRTSAARIALVLSAALLGATAAASADLDVPPDLSRGLDLPLGADFNLRMPRVCEEDAAERGYYPPAPRYVYDNRRGATWTGNGWVYLPIGEHPPDERTPRVAVTPPPHGFGPGEVLMFPCRVLKQFPDYLPFDLPLR